MTNTTKKLAKRNDMAPNSVKRFWPWSCKCKCTKISGWFTKNTSGLKAMNKLA